jgi:heterodisulfide reductase subunit C
MDFTELRDSVEHLAGVVRRLDSAAGEDVSEEQAAAAQAVLTFGQVAVGVFEELHAIRKALEAIALSERRHGEDPRP